MLCTTPQTNVCQMLLSASHIAVDVNCFLNALNPYVTNGLPHCYYFDESTFIFRGSRANFSFLFHFSMKIMKAKRIAPDGTPLFSASHLRLFCLSVPHKKDTRLIWVNELK